MRILVTSDLHYGQSPRGDRATEALARAACEREAGALVVAGDIGTGPDAVRRCLELFRGFRGARLVVPGNHDVWIARDRPGDSWRLHDELLPGLFEAAGFHPLHARPWVGEGVAFAGTMGWYDYSFGDEPGIPLESYQTKVLPGQSAPIWNDVHFVRFGASDAEVTTELAGRLRAQLRAIPPGMPIVAVSHHLVTRLLLPGPRRLVPRMWRFVQAFLGAEVLGQVLAADPRVSRVLCGHAHRPWTARLEGRPVAVIGSDYEVKELAEVTADGKLRRERFDAGDRPSRSLLVRP